MARNAEVLPQPEGPNKQAIVPLAKAKLKFWTTAREPY
jgi:hypothetical protein